MKIEPTYKRNKNVNAAEISVGAVFSVITDKKEYETFNKGVFLRIFGGIVDLESPNRTWDHIKTFEFDEVIFYPNAKVVLGLPQ